MENPESSQPMDETPPYDESEPAPEPAMSPPRRRLPVGLAASAELPQKSPILAAFLSFLPGLGNIYNGLYKRGVTFFLAFVSLFAIGFASGEGVHLALLIPCTIFTWFFNVFDAYRQAILINYGYHGDVDEAKLNMGGWGLAPGIFLVAVGLYGVLREYLDISWDLLLAQWPWLLIVGGGGLIVQHFRERASASDEI